MMSDCRHHSSDEALRSMGALSYLNRPCGIRNVVSLLDFLAWLRFCAFWVFLWVFRCTAKAFSLLCSSQRLDLSHPCASFLMNCHVTPIPWRRNSCLNCGERPWVINTIAIISCWVMSFRSHSSAMSSILLEYATIPSPCSCGSLRAPFFLRPGDVALRSSPL